MAAVGIDFGTTNSLVAHLNGGRPEALVLDDMVPADWAEAGFDRVMASVMSLREDGSVAFGWEAKMDTAEKVEAVKRSLSAQEAIEVGGNYVLVEELTAAFFAKLREQAMRRAGIQFDQAVVTVPANSLGIARYRTRICAGMAGIQVLALLNEPTAAAMAFGRTLERDQNVLVVDWGGGTLDVTLLETVEGVFIEKSSKGVQALGGKDFDSAFASEVAGRVAGSDAWSRAEKDLFRREIEWAKIRLSTQDAARVQLPNGETRDVTRADFEAVVRRLVERVGPPVRKCLADMGMVSADIDAVLLVGGTCKTPAVRRFIEELLERSAVGGVDPMTAIAEGAALAAGILTNEIDDADFFVATEHALGVVVAQNDRLKFSEIIPRNHALPVEKSDVFSPVNDFQDSVMVRVIEGDPDEPLDSPSNVLLREWPIPIDPPRAAAEAPFEVKFRYDIDGILHVDVTDLTLEKVVSKDEVIFEAARDPSEMVEMSKRAQDIASGGQLDSSPSIEASSADEMRMHDSLGKARTKVLPFLDAAEAERLTGLCEALEQASPADRGPAQEALDQFLRAYSYLF